MYFCTIRKICTHDGHELATVWPRIRDRRKILILPKMSNRCQVPSFWGSIFQFLLIMVTQKWSKSQKHTKIFESSYNQHHAPNDNNQPPQWTTTMIASGSASDASTTKVVRYLLVNNKISSQNPISVHRQDHHDGGIKRKPCCGDHEDDTAAGAFDAIAMMAKWNDVRPSHGWWANDSWCRNQRRMM